ncbi:MAG: NUDIX domain-containing protein [Clostridia bacterium]|nr:NUDIX domain-containing protein [Clostridia bacterium]
MDIQEKACGCIIIKDNKVLLIQQNAGHWGFPKGHVEENESEQETAIREVKEETNIDVKITDTTRYTVEYMHKGNLKQVVLFIAEPISNDLKPQAEEISVIEWLSFEDALNRFTYDNVRDLFVKILKEKHLI